VKRRLEIRNNLSELDAVLAWVNALAADATLPDGLAGELFLVAEEVLANTISYGYDDEDEHRIEIEAVLDERRLNLTFRDDARPFDPLSAPEPDLSLPVEDRPIGGLGVHLVKAIADRVRYTRERGKNVLIIEKEIPPEEKT
jgi:anti-sigma regulatory factor (Ser/Thr protein kinase)